MKSDKYKNRKHTSWKTFREIIGSYLAVVVFLPLLYMAMTEQTRFIGVDTQYIAETGFLFIFILILRSINPSIQNKIHRFQLSCLFLAITNPYMWYNNNLLA